MLPKAQPRMAPPDFNKLMNIADTVGAVLFTPIITLRIESRIQYRADREREKVNIFATLLSRLHEIGSTAVFRELNLIDVVFADHDAVREAWSRYYAVLNDTNFQNPAGWGVRD